MSGTVYGMRFDRKWYIGQALDYLNNGRTHGMEGRKTTHALQPYRESTANLLPYLYPVIREHGIDAFEFHELAWAPTDDALDELERQYIHQYNSIHPNGYNADSGGKKGFTRCQQTRDKLRKLEDDRGLPAYLERFSTDQPSEGWVAYHDGLRRAFVSKKYTMDQKKDFARHFLETGLVHEDYDPANIEDPDPNNWIAKHGSGFSSWYQGVKRGFTSEKYSTEDLKRFALHYRSTGEDHADYRPDEKPVDDFKLPTFVYARFDDRQKLRGFEFMKPEQARKTFADAAKTLQENFEDAIAHRAAVLADPDSYRPEQRVVAIELPTHVQKHEHKGVLVGYRIKFARESKYFQWNKAFTSTAFTPEENLVKAKEYLSTIPFDDDDEIEERDDSLPTEELPKFINLYKPTKGSHGYRVKKPGHKSKAFTSSKLTMRQKLQSARDYLLSL